MRTSKRTSLFSCHHTSSPSSHADDASIAANQHATRIIKASIRERRDSGQRRAACTVGLPKAGKNTRAQARARARADEGGARRPGKPCGKEHQLPSTKKREPSIGSLVANTIK